MTKPHAMSGSSVSVKRDRVAVVSVSYGSEDVLEGFLSSVAAASTEPPLIIVADNKQSSGGTRAIAEKFGAGYVPLDNRGYGFAVNEAVRKLPASVTWVLVSNPDIVLSPHSVDTLRKTGEEDARIAAVGPAVLSPGGDVYPSARAIPSLRTGIGHALFANLWPTNPWTRAYKGNNVPSLVRRDAGWLSGACLLVRRSTFDRLDGFDTGYFMYFEDVDLGFRIGKLGLRNVYEPDATVMHIGATSTKADSHRMIDAHHASAKRFLARKYGGFILWPLRLLLNIGLDLRSYLAGRRT
jgi:N-acetylglucosaminyl-diphospho-decaprenol L-rhamnosyltransferase